MNKPYLERVKETVKINNLCFLSETDIWEILDTSKAIIFDGHFELLSKKHTDTFFRFAAISQYPSLVAKISKELVAWLKNCSSCSPNVILGPASQGMFFAYDIARELNGALGCRAVYAAIDKDSGRPKERLVEGCEIYEGERVVIVNDMTSTGHGLETLIRLAKDRYRAEVIAICIFANRGKEEQNIHQLYDKYNIHSIIDLTMPSWSEDQCNLCRERKPLIESKHINHLPIYSDENTYARYIKQLKLVA